jgi:hypothetical protein
MQEDPERERIRRLLERGFRVPDPFDDEDLTGGLIGGVLVVVAALFAAWFLTALGVL